ncbi:MAG: RsmE family RNA methyltransferase [candidate division Zixibacteria bacterium]|nr:RsmE family RNA methyltransferase [candidate division Zixibacteria bacterium]
MTAPIFYAPPKNRTENTIILPAVEGKHAQSVMRLKRGDPVIVVDGLGIAFRGELTSGPRSKQVTVRIHTETRHFGEASVRLTLAAGLSAGYKFDKIIEKGTELGVTRFVPLLTAKSRVKLEDPKRITTRLKRWEKVALSAIKQSHRSYIPNISTPTRLADFLQQIEHGSLNLIFHTDQSVPPFDKLQINFGFQRAYVLIGPESGFSQDEYLLALRAGFKATKLGSRILRTETAGPVACALVMNALGELR